MQVCWEMFGRHFSITMQRNRMRFGGIVALNSGCLMTTLGPYSFFGFDTHTHTHTHTHTLRIDSLIENELAMSEEVEERLKVLRTSINEVGPTGVRGTAPAWEGGGRGVRQGTKWQ